MKAKMTVQFTSGREEIFEFYPAESDVTAGLRIKEFVKSPNLALQTKKEVIIIPSTAIECITITRASDAPIADLIPVNRVK